MEFRTKVDLPVGQWEISHASRLMLWGSCFTEHIGNRLSDYKFRCDVNPYGILYNPLSIARALTELETGKVYVQDDLILHNDEWHSLMHHGSFSSVMPETCLRQINERNEKARKHLAETDWLLFTWGTARVYEWNEDGQVVGNCHKLPEKSFTRRLLDPEEITVCYENLLEKLHTQNPSLQVLFTVSPIRHARDGMHGNQLSKAVLLLAADRLCRRLPYCHYFPAYEILMDELRDYRFYADDMLHPSSLAVDYVWECFSEVSFSPSTRQIMKMWEDIRRGLAHRPFHAEGEAYQRFLRQILLKIEQLKEKFPYLDTLNEEQICQRLLKK